jgi:hemolysin-activating ACP:hemolysin acyltransferase
MSSNALEGLAAHIVSESAQLGVAALLLVDTDRKRLSISALVAWLVTPIRLGQALFIYSPEGRPLGFATWAFLDDESAGRLGGGTLDLLSQDDWNDGERLWIVDFVAPYGDARKLASALREQLAPSHPRFEFVRRRNSGIHWGRGTAQPASSGRSARGLR